MYSVYEASPAAEWHQGHPGIAPSALWVVPQPGLDGGNIEGYMEEELIKNGAGEVKRRDERNKSEQNFN